MHACIGEPGCIQGPAKRICLHLGLVSVRAALRSRSWAVLALAQSSRMVRSNPKPQNRKP